MCCGWCGHVLAYFKMVYLGFFFFNLINPGHVHTTPLMFAVFEVNFILILPISQNIWKKITWKFWAQERFWLSFFFFFTWILGHWVDHRKTFASEDETSTVRYSHQSNVQLRIKTQTLPSPYLFPQQTCSTPDGVLGLFYKCLIHRSPLMIYCLILVANLRIWCVISAGHNEWFLTRGCCVEGERAKEIFQNN